MELTKILIERKRKTFPEIFPNAQQEQNVTSRGKKSIESFKINEFMVQFYP